MKDKANEIFDLNGNRVYADSIFIPPFNINGAQESLDQTPSNSGSSLDGKEPLSCNNELAQEIVKLEEVKKIFLKKIEDKFLTLDNFPDNFLERVMNEPCGIDEVHEEAVRDNLPKIVRRFFLVLKLRKVTALACSLCERVYFNYIHYLMHIRTDDHANRMAEQSTMKQYILWKEFIDIFSDDIVSWQTAESSFSDGKNFYHYVRNSPCYSNARPTEKWMEDIKESTFQFLTNDLTREEKNFIMGELENHVRGLSVCDFCMEAFKSSREFLEHCLTFGHVEMMYKMEREGPKVTMQNLTMIWNELSSEFYIESVNTYVQFYPDSAESCWELVKNFLPFLPTGPSKKRTKSGLPSHVENGILTSCKDFRDGKSMKEMMGRPDYLPLSQLIEPCEESFSCLVGRIQEESNYDKNPLNHVERITDIEVKRLFFVISQTLDKGLPWCFFCDTIFENADKFCNHLLTRDHQEKFCNYTCSDIPSIKEMSPWRVHEAVQIVLLEYFKRHWLYVSVDLILPTDFIGAISTDHTNYYCDACLRPFVDFSFYIAHFWSKAHLYSVKGVGEFKNRDAYIGLVIRNASNEQLSRFSKEVIDKYSARDPPFVRERISVEMRDKYFTLYIHILYQRKYEIWRKRQSYKRDKGILKEYDEERHVPDKKIISDIDEKMLRRHEIAPYAWWDQESHESMLFRNYFFVFPPSTLWNSLNNHMKKKGTTPYCHECEREFRSADDYYLHFGEDEHPYPKGMNEPMAGFIMLVHIMYSEKRVGVDLDEYLPIVPLQDQDIPIISLSTIV